MQIKKIIAKNFLSYQNLELDLESYNGIVKISGKNLDTVPFSSNGSGKSSIFEIITFGLFGRSLRKSTEESIVNSKAGKELEVEISITKPGIGEVEIRRTKRPTSLLFLLNGEARNLENAIETQKLIEETLAIDYKSFLASVAYGQDQGNFLESSPEDKRNIIKNCFSLDDFFSKRDSVKEIKSKLTGELKVFNTLVESLVKEKDKLKIPEKKYKYIELPSLESVLEAEKQITKFEAGNKEIQAETRVIQDSLRKMYKALEQGIFNEEKDCPVCKSSYTKCQTQEDLDEIGQHIALLEDDVVTNNKAVEVCKREIEKLKPEYPSSLWAKYNEKNKLILDQQKILDRHKELEDQIKDYDKQINEATSLIEVMKFWELAFSEKGLIRYVIRNILDYLNLRANEYVSILTNNQFSIVFNDELVEKITNNGQEVKFISLSGGERKKLNLGIMLSLQDLGSKISRTNCNLIFFDEVVDNIDSLGVENVYTLLSLLSKQYSDKIILLITHNQKLNELLGECQEIKVIKEKGISRLADGKI